MPVDQAARLRELAYQSTQHVRKDSAVPAGPCAKIIAVASGKGGVGKTNLSVNLGIALAKRGKRVCLVDLDLGLANVDIVLDVEAQYTLEHLMRGYKTIDEIIVRGPEGLYVIPGGSGLSTLTELTDSQRDFFIHQFHRLALNHDYIIFDTAAGISPNVIKFVLAADEIIVVTTEEPTAITDAYALIKIVGKKNPESHINFVMNMVRSVQGARKTFDRINGVVNQFLGLSLHSLGHVVHDHCVSDAVMKRKPFITTFPLCAASKSVKDVAKALLEKELPQGHKRHMFDRWMRVFSAQAVA